MIKNISTLSFKIYIVEQRERERKREHRKREELSLSLSLYADDETKFIHQ